MDLQTTITLSSIVLSIILLLRAAFGHISAKKQKHILESLKNEVALLKENETREKEFQQSLKHAAVTTNLEKTRSAYTHKKEKLQAPERYGYAKAMFQSGMASDKIGTALGMSAQEITQLAKLANLGVQPADTRKR